MEVGWHQWPILTCGVFMWTSGSFLYCIKLTCGEQWGRGGGGRASWCWSLSIGVGKWRWSRMRCCPHNWGLKICDSQCEIVLPYSQPSRWHTLNCKVRPINVGRVIAHALVCPSALLLCNRGSKSVRTEMCPVSLHLERPQLNNLYKP